MPADHDVQQRIVLIDDHALLREVTSEMLDAEPDMIVVASAACGLSGIEHCRREQPDIVLLDVDIPGESVARTADAIRAVSPSTRIVVNNMLNEPTLLRKLLDGGVRGYLINSVSRKDLVSTIRAVCADDDRVVLHVSAEALANIASAASCPEALTKRELEILSLVSKAMSNRQISRRLTIAEGTVKRHLGSIFTKLDASTRLDAVNKAIATGLLTAVGPDL